MATEKRLIDAQHYDKILEDREISLMEYSGSISGAIKGCRALLEDEPTVDAVSVVRCKDCKYCERDHTLDGGGDEYYYCWHDVMEHGQARANEFCCYGEKK